MAQIRGFDAIKYVNESNRVESILPKTNAVKDEPPSSMRDIYVAWFVTRCYHVGNIDAQHSVIAESAIPVVLPIEMEWSVRVVMYLFLDRSNAGMLMHVISSSSSLFHFCDGFFLPICCCVIPSRCVFFLS